MRLSELSERSGVSTATIKFYLREGVLPAGERISATQAAYGEPHLRRLLLIRGLVQIGRVPVSTLREVFQHIEDETLSTNMRLGAALWSLPQPIPIPDAEEPAVQESTQDSAPAGQDVPAEAAGDPHLALATEELESLLTELGWSHVQELGALSPTYRSLTAGIAAISRVGGLGYEPGDLLPYARTLHQLACMDLDRLEALPADAERVEAAVSAAVLIEPILLALRRLAQQEESTRRYGY